MALPTASDNVFPKIIGEEQGSTPATPASGTRKLYPKADGWYDLDDAGTETGPLGTGGGGGGGSTGIGWIDESGNPDVAPGSPNTEDDEFNAGTLDAKWTQSGGGTLSFANSRATLNLPASATDVVIYQSYVPGASTAFTITAKYTGCVVISATQYYGISVYDSSGVSGSAPLAACRLQSSSGTQLQFHREVGGSGTQANVGPSGVDFYIRLSRDASNNYTFGLSFDGLQYSTYGVSGASSASTVGRIALRMGQSTTLSYLYGSVDWFRRT